MNLGHDHSMSATTLKLKAANPARAPSALLASCTVWILAATRLTATAPLKSLKGR